MWQSTQPRLSKQSVRIPTMCRSSSTLFPFHHNNAHSRICYPLTHMSFPDLIEVPNAFGKHLKFLGLHFTQTVFGHYQSRPIGSNSWFNELATMEWCKRMDSLLVSPRRLHILSKQTYPSRASSIALSINNRIMRL